MTTAALIAALTNEELTNLRGPWCPDPDCGARDCDEATCDRCGKHGGAIISIPRADRAPVIRTVCTHCRRERECACCEARLPRYLLVHTGNEEGDGELFCEPCCHVSPFEDW